MFKFQCDSCLNTAEGTIINDAILKIEHTKLCEFKKGIPVHFTRVEVKKTVCKECDDDNCKNCLGMVDGNACECCYINNFS